MRKEIIGDCTLYLGDCLEVMPTLGKVDAVVTDPPYKVTARAGRTTAGGMMLDKKMRSGDVFEHNDTSLEIWLPKTFEILKDTGHAYVMSNNKNLSDFYSVIEKSDYHLIKTLVWAKDNKIMSQAYMSQTEFIFFMRKGAFVRINDCGVSDLLQFKNIKTLDDEKKPIHPSEKPVEMMEVLITGSTAKNETVLDPFMGVGSSGIACVLASRKFIGIEIDEKYFDIACKRIEQAYAQPDMFVEPVIKPTQEKML